MLAAHLATAQHMVLHDGGGTASEIACELMSPQFNFLKPGKEAILIPSLGNLDPVHRKEADSLSTIRYAESKNVTTGFVTQIAKGISQRTTYG
jgi:hypothetical protein